jgi:hypothetical protein
MLWKYSLPFSGYIDAPADIAEARKVLAEKLRTDPYAFINKLEPAEPSPHTLVDLGKKVFGMK